MFTTAAAIGIQANDARQAERDREFWNDFDNDGRVIDNNEEAEVAPAVPEM
jgi:hypothetical protein